MLPNYKEARKTIVRFKAAGAYGLQAELFKSISVYGNQILLHPIHKKGDPTVCVNNRGISLCNIAYMLQSKVMCNRLKSAINKLAGYSPKFIYVALSETYPAV